MKLFRHFVFALALPLLPSGCVYMDTTQVGEVETNTQFQLRSDDFKVIERVSVTGETTLWFGLVALGGRGYQALLEKANEVGGDTIMDYSFDYKIKSVLFFIYYNVEWEATGLAVKLSDSIRQ